GYKRTIHSIANIGSEMLVLTVLITAVLILCTPLIWWYLTLAKFSSLHKIPGPTPLPIIGNSGEVGKTTVDLLDFFMKLNKKYGSIMKIWFGPRLHLIITKPEVVEFFLNSNVHLSKSNGYDLFKPWLGDGLLVSTGSKWKTRRKMITPTFHFKILETFLETSFNKQVNVLIDVLLKEASKSDKSIEMHSIINLCSLDIICETAFGTELNAQAKCNRKYVEAGHDTTTTSICFVLYAIAQNPEVQEKVYEELLAVLGPDYRKEIHFGDIQQLKYLDIVIKEAHRLYPPVPLIERSLEEDCTIDGVTIPKDTNISIFLYGMNYSSEVYPQPEVFDPERFLPENQGIRHNFAYVPFSAGPRNCIGQKFALLELKTTIAKLLRCFEISPDPNIPPEVGMCSVLKSRNGIYMNLKIRNQ
ncbi:p450 domain containing protein, partial [Asbolus verrucosus]